MIAVDRDRGWSLRAALRGASRAVMPAYGAGALVALVAGLPIVITAGAAALAGVIVGAARSISR